MDGTFLAGPDLTTFRILEIEPNMDEPTSDRFWHTVWTVEVPRLRALHSEIVTAVGTDD